MLVDLRLLNLTWRFYLTHHLVWFTDITKHVLTICDSLRAENGWLYTLERSGSLVLTAASSITVVDVLMVLHVERRQDEGSDIVLSLEFLSSDVIELTYS